MLFEYNCYKYILVHQIMPIDKREKKSLGGHLLPLLQQILCHLYLIRHPSDGNNAVIWPWKRLIYGDGCTWILTDFANAAATFTNYCSCKLETKKKYLKTPNTSVTQHLKYFNYKIHIYTTRLFLYLNTNLFYWFIGCHKIAVKSAP